MSGFKDFVGQTAIKQLIGAKVQLAKTTGIPLPHLLLCGEAEQGKMTFATAIADESGVPATCVAAISLEKFLDLTGRLSNLRQREIFAIGDVEALRPSIADRLIEAISRFQVEILVGDKRHVLPLPKFTFVGTTSKPWAVDERLRRWCVVCQLSSYTPDEACEIVTRIAEGKGLSLSNDAAAELASQCKFHPGEAEVFLQKVASCFPGGSSTKIDRVRLRQFNDFLGSGGSYPVVLTVADQLRTMNGVEFEQWVADIFRRAGFTVELTGVTGDHGVDLWVSGQGSLIAVQCKKWDDSVGEPVVRDLFGSMISGKAQHGCIVVTSSFTPQAYEFADGKPIRLIAFDTLMEVVRNPERLRQLFQPDQ